MLMAFEAENQSKIFLSHELRAGVSWRLFVFLLILFSALTLTYVGLEFGYKFFLNESISGYEKRIEELAAKVGPSEQKNLIQFYSQLANLKSILDNHYFSSNLLSFLETTTHPKVAYTSVIINSGNSALTVSGVTGSYEDLAAQLAFWEKNKYVRRVVLGQNSYQGGAIRFNLNLYLDPSVFSSTWASSQVTQ